MFDHIASIGLILLGSHRVELGLWIRLDCAAVLPVAHLLIYAHAQCSPLYVHLEAIHFLDVRLP